MVKRMLWLLALFYMLPLSSVSANGSSGFTVYMGHRYVPTSEQLSAAQIGSKLGQVTRYSDEEGRYSGNFSNLYPKGTAYYAIIGIDLQDAIAIQASPNNYIKAKDDGPYSGNRPPITETGGMLLLGVLLVVIASLLIYIRSGRGKRSISTGRGSDG